MRMKTGNEKIQFTSFEGTMTLSWIESLWWDQIKPEISNENLVFKKIQKLDNLESLIKIAAKHSNFEHLCQQSICDPYWNKFYIFMGYALSRTKRNPINFLIHEDRVNPFDLLRGAFFFHKSQLVREESGVKFLHSELLFLKEAIKYDSIHAVEQYNSYLSQKIEESNSKEEKKYLFKEIINNCKNMLELYGSYAYMMLAEAFYHYAEFYLEHNEWQRAQFTIIAAKTAIECAQLYLQESQPSIHNAGLGDGLEKSNSFAFYPDEFLDYIDEWFLKYNPVQKNCPIPSQLAMR
jgi:hypothetical protein